VNKINRDGEQSTGLGERAVYPSETRRAAIARHVSEIAP
jgi:hypothetical protein